MGRVVGRTLRVKQQEEVLTMSHQDTLSVWGAQRVAENGDSSQGSLHSLSNFTLSEIQQGQYGTVEGVLKSDRPDLGPWFFFLDLDLGQVS